MYWSSLHASCGSYVRMYVCYSQHPALVLYPLYEIPTTVRNSCLPLSGVLCSLFLSGLLHWYGSLHSAPHSAECVQYYVVVPTYICYVRILYYLI